MNNPTNTTHGTVKVPHEFFKKVRHDYRQWRQATIRELLQNCYDAGATRIDFSVGRTVSFDGTPSLTTLRCTDNGHGMSRDTLENVFLVLGGSKKEANSLGGFGMAKMVLFSAERYTIGINGCYAIGRGSEYEIRADRPQQGVSVMLEYLDVTMDMWMQEIKTYVAQCNLDEFRKVEITLNGEVVPQNVDAYEFDDGAGMSYTTWGEDYSRVTWCCRGLAMFTETYWSEGNSNFKGRGELGAINPLETFTTNRDAFRTEVSEQKKNQVNRLIQNHKARVQGRGFHAKLNETAPWDFDCGFNPSEGGPVLINHYPNNFHMMIDGFHERRTAKQGAYVSQSELNKTMASKNSGTLARQWVAACRLVLSTDYALENGVKMFAGVNEVADMATSHVEIPVTEMEHYMHGQRIEMGFAFTAGAEGLCRPNLKELYVNPKELPDDTRLLDLYDLALHECTHLWAANHSEQFTQVEYRLRRSMRRWMDENQIVDILAAA